jgi:hypothetical protein
VTKSAIISPTCCPASKSYSVGQQSGNKYNEKRAIWATKKEEYFTESKQGQGLNK